MLVTEIDRKLSTRLSLESISNNCVRVKGCFIGKEAISNTFIIKGHGVPRNVIVTVVNGYNALVLATKVLI